MSLVEDYLTFFVFLRTLHFLVSMCVVCVVWVVSLYQVAERFRVDGSGSGDGDVEFFLPTIRKRGKQLFKVIYDAPI